jgi:dihydroorotate dehydrogenase
LTLYGLVRPLLFQVGPRSAHALAMGALGLPEHLAPLRALAATRYVVEHPSLQVRTMGLTFPNPIGVAGGFDKDGRRARALAALGFGHVELGTVTASGQAENPPPNLFRLPADRALINRLGFPNRGARALAARLAGGRPCVPIGVSIGKSRAVPVDDMSAVVADYLASFEAVQAVADFVVVNVSSPNTKNLRAIQRAEAASALLTAIAAARDRRADADTRRLPLLLKVSPDLDEEALDALLDVVASARLDGLVATNTTITRSGLRTPPDVVEAMGEGGLSGPPLRETARRFVRRARARLGSGATIIGVGGVSSADDVRALRDAGADLCQLYTAFIYEGPGLAARICRDLLAG